ncbi:MAG TPA: hypothetical protein VJ456_03515, partial [Acidimicrobiia bacterium]|nr:hypothetical protein [Acidimicrobiia bacterium]
EGGAVPIDFTLGEEQEQLRANARAFAEGVLAGVAERLDAIQDRAEAFYAQRDIYVEFAKAGFTKSSSSARTSRSAAC